MDTTILSRMATKFDINDHACQVWTGALNSKGYGCILYEGKVSLAHRVAWELQWGPIPDGLVVDHQCRERRCVNPAHLRLVTPKVNSLENSVGLSALNAQKTHCPQGHRLEGENVRVDKRGKRVCKECHNAENRKARMKKKENIK